MNLPGLRWALFFDNLFFYLYNLNVYNVNKESVLRVAILGDIHIGARNDSLVVAENHISFFRDQLFPFMKKHKIKTIFQLGDIFDRRKFVNFQVLDLWKREFFDYMSKHDIEMTVLLGNHDVYHKNINDVSSPALLLREYSNITVVKEPQEFIVGGQTCLFVPWINKTNYQSTLDAITKSTATQMFGHLELKNFEMDKGHKNEDGMDAELFKKFDAVYSGHFHHRSSSGNISYVGTPYQLTWVDEQSIKGFHVMDMDSGKVEFHENPNRLFHKLVYNDEHDSDNYHAGFDLSGITGKYIKIVVVNKQNLYGFDQFMSRLYAQTPADVKIVELMDINNSDDEEDEQLDIKSTEEILDKYIDSIDNISLDKKKLKTMIRKLYVEASTLEQV